MIDFNLIERNWDDTLGIGRHYDFGFVFIGIVGVIVLLFLCVAGYCNHEHRKKEKHERTGE